MLKKIGVDIHPDSHLSREPQAFHVLFEQLALRTSEDFRAAYAEARHFGKALGKRGKGGGFMKNLMEQRICSSIVAGLNTANALLEGRTVSEEDNDELIELAVAADNSEEMMATPNCGRLSTIWNRKNGWITASLFSANTTTPPAGLPTHWQPATAKPPLACMPGQAEAGFTIKDEWIEDIETLGEKLDEYINAQRQANGFDLRYNTRSAPSGKDWRDCAGVLSRTDSELTAPL